MAIATHPIRVLGGVESVESRTGPAGIHQDFKVAVVPPAISSSQSLS
jgi:hypothetical protein